MCARLNVRLRGIDGISRLVKLNLFLLSDHEILSLVTHKIGTVFHRAAHTILILKEEQLRAASQLCTYTKALNSQGTKTPKLSHSRGIHI